MTNKVDTSLWDIEAKQHSKRVYFNKPQLLTQYIGAKTTVIVAGRRTGKTDSIASPFVLRNMQRMPGSTGGIVVPTFKHGLTNTLPGLLAAWKRWGYINGVHYVVGRKPPKSFSKPITELADYEHVITFYNGSVAIIISQDRPGSSNSLTLSWLLIDEAKFIDYNKLKDETLPANGGIRSYFGHHNFNHSMMVLSDMPQTTKGSWSTSTRSATTASSRRRSRIFTLSTPTTSSLRLTARSTVARTRTSTQCSLSALAWTTMLISTGLCAVSLVPTA